MRTSGLSTYFVCDPSRRENDGSVPLRRFACAQVDQDQNPRTMRSLFACPVTVIVPLLPVLSVPKASDSRPVGRIVLPCPVMANTMTSGSKLAELSAVQKYPNDLLASLETPGLQHGLCTLLIDNGVVSKQWLLAEAHRPSFAAARRTHPCGWNTTLLCMLQRRDVVSRIASGFSDRKECAGLLTASTAFATSVTEGSSAMSRPKLLVRGGNDDPSVDIFDPVSTTWNTLPSEQQWREEAATAVISGRINVCDGYAGGPFRQLGLLDIWQTLPPMSQGRREHGAAVFGTRLYVCGGWKKNSTQCFDTRNNTWSSLPNMRRERAGAGAAVIRGRVCVVGGAEDLWDSSVDRLQPKNICKRGRHLEFSSTTSATSGCTFTVPATSSKRD